MVAAEDREAGESSEAEGTEKALNRISGSIIGAAIEIHRWLGPGMLESTYQECLERELISRGHSLERQHEIPLIYKGEVVRQRFRLDLIVDCRVLVEIRTVQCLLPVHEAQILSYLRLAGLPLGLLINFHGPTLIAGLRRFRVSVPSSPSVTSSSQRKGE